MNQLTKIYPEGWLLYCPDCFDYITQSDPQNDSRRKSVVVDGEPCKKCKARHAEEILEAQQLLGRLGTKP